MIPLNVPTCTWYSSFDLRCCIISMTASIELYRSPSIIVLHQGSQDGVRIIRLDGEPRAMIERFLKVAKTAPSVAGIKIFSATRIKTLDFSEHRRAGFGRRLSEDIPLLYVHAEPIQIGSNVKQERNDQLVASGYFELLRVVRTSSELPAHNSWKCRNASRVSIHVPINRSRDIG